MRHKINAVCEKFAFWKHKINAVLQKNTLRVYEINADWGSRIKKNIFLKFYFLFFIYEKGFNSTTSPLLAPSTARTTPAAFNPFKIVWRPACLKYL